MDAAWRHVTLLRTYGVYTCFLYLLLFSCPHVFDPHDPQAALTVGILEC